MNFSAIQDQHLDPGSRQREVDFTCPDRDCRNTWRVMCHVERNECEPVDEEETACPECGIEGEC